MVCARVAAEMVGRAVRLCSAACSSLEILSPAATNLTQCTMTWVLNRLKGVGNMFLQVWSGRDRTERLCSQGCQQARIRYALQRLTSQCPGSDRDVCRLRVS